MLTKAEARAIAAAHIQEGRETPDGWTPLIVDSETMETEFAWIFFYQSEGCLLTGSISEALAGNAPIVVDRTDGTISARSSSTSKSTAPSNGGGTT